MGNNKIRGAQLKSNWLVHCLAQQIAPRMWMAVLSALAVWIAFVNVPAHAFQEVQPSPDASGTGPNVGWYQPGYPHTNELDPTDPQLDKAAAMVLPDLRTLPPSDLRILILSEGRRSLRLANTIWNSGKGPLELTGEFNAATQRTRVHQHIYTADGNQREFLVGEFVWHPTPTTGISMN